MNTKTPSREEMLTNLSNLKQEPVTNHFMSTGSTLAMTVFMGELTKWTRIHRSVATGLSAKVLEDEFFECDVNLFSELSCLDLALQPKQSANMFDEQSEDEQW